MTDRVYLQQLRIPTNENPLRILMSACLVGITCGWDGTAYGEFPTALKILQYDTAKVVNFCPEDFSFGSPRAMCDIHGGTGFDVLDGKAKLLSDSGKDWSEGIIKASKKMLEIAQKEHVELAILMDISAACGSQVIYNGSRFADNKVYQVGVGVAAAQLIRHGFKVISQRDFASLEMVYAKLDPNYQIDSTKLDHHENEWYKSYFNIT